MKLINPDSIFTEGDLCDFLGISKRTLSRQVKKKTFPSGGRMGKKKIWVGREILAAFASLSTIKTEDIEPK